MDCSDHRKHRCRPERLAELKRAQLRLLEHTSHNNEMRQVLPEPAK
jgi:hypothetical protein